MVRVQRGNQAFHRVIEENRTNPNFVTKFKFMGVIKKGFVLPNRFAFIVEDGPAACHPAWVHRRVASIDEAGLGLDLALYLSSKAIRIGEVDMDLKAIRWQRATCVCLTSKNSS